MALESGAACAIDTAPVIARAHALAARQEPYAAAAEGGETTSAMRVTATAITAAAALQSATAQPAAALAVVEATDSDPALREIFSRETAAHIATVRAFLGAERDRPAPHVLTEDVYRACHTLSGSSKAAVARHGIRLAGPLDHWMRKSHDSGVGLTSEDLALVDDCMQAMEGVVGHLDEATGFFQTHDQLRARIARAETDLDRRVCEAAAAAEAAQAASLPPQPAAIPEVQAPAVSADYDPEIAGDLRRGSR